MMNTFGFRLRCVLLLTLYAAGGLATARADISQVSTDARIEAEAQVSSEGDRFPARDDDNPPNEFDVTSYNKTAMADAAKEGRRAKGRASQNTSLTFSANSLSFSASATTEATASRTGDETKDGRTGAGGSTSFSVNFQVNGKSRFALGGTVSLQTNGSTGSTNVQVELSGSTDEGEDVRFNFEAEDDPGDPRSVSISKSGELKPGSYSLFIFALSTIGDTQPSSRTNLQASLSVSSAPPVPDEGEEIRWISTTGGSFFDPANWRPQRVPTKTDTRSDTAIFGLSTDYDVSLAGAAAATFALAAAGAANCERCVVTNGDLDLGGGSLSVVGTSPVDPSLVVAENGKLNLTGGTLSTQNALLGKEANRFGEAHVFNAGTRWENAGRLTIGDKGEGRLFIANGGFLTTLETQIGVGNAKGSAVVGGDFSQWETGNMKVGLTSPGEIKIESGGAANSEDVIIGAGSSNGAVLVDGVSGSGKASSWLVTNALTVGGTGAGTLSITNGGIFEGGALLIGGVAAAPGIVNVSGAPSETVRSTLSVSGAGIGFIGGVGTLNVLDGGLVKFSEGPGLYLVGRNARGIINVTGFDPETFETSEVEMKSPNATFDVGFGVGGEGQILIRDGCLMRVECLRMEVGAGDFGVGTVTVEGSSPNGILLSNLSVIGTLQLGGATGGQGVLTINRGRVFVVRDVNIFANGILQGIGTLECVGTINSDGIISPGLSPGTLTLQGNLVQGATGVVQAEIAGPAAGVEHDQLIVTGNATFDGKLVLQFMNGFAPRAGDQFSVVNVNGTATSNFSEVQIAGLEPGAQLETTTTGGVLTATALNDGVALPTVSVKAGGKKKRASEKGRKPAVFLISRTGSNAAPLTVNYKIKGTAENGVDYLFVPGTVTIPARKNAVALRFRPFDDKSVEGDETLQLEIIPGADYTHSLQSTAEVTLLDNARKVR